MPDPDEECCVIVQARLYVQNVTLEPWLNLFLENLDQKSASRDCGLIVRADSAILDEDLPTLLPNPAL